jgi:hypothetical protein
MESVNRADDGIARKIIAGPGRGVEEKNLGFPVYVSRSWEEADAKRKLRM